MELIGGIIGVVIFWVGVQFVLSLIGHGMRAGGRAVKKAVTGKETYFGPPQLKFVDDKHEETGWLIKENHVSWQTSKYKRHEHIICDFSI